MAFETGLTGLKGAARLSLPAPPIAAAVHRRF